MEKIIITIGHEYCSGGREIGKETADRLGIAYYDSEIIDEAAKTSGLSAEYIKKSEESDTSSFLYNVVMNAGYASSFFNQSKETLPLDMQVYLAQQEAILKFAKESRVIVGRCADYVLQDEKNLFRCFTYASTESRIERAVKEHGADRDGAKKLIHQMDKKRSQHYNSYTEQVWGARGTYDLMIDSSVFGIGGTCDLIIKGLECRKMI